MKKRKSLFSPAVGGKSSVTKYPVDDYRYYRYIVEPFVHSGPLTIDRLLKFGKPTGSRFAVVADADPTIVAIWRVWQDPVKRQNCDQFIKHYSDRVVEFAQSGVTRETLKDRIKLVNFFDELKYNFENPYSVTFEHLAAVSLVLRKLVFGGVVRCNTLGKLNVAVSYDKLIAFPNWQHKWIDLDPLCEVKIESDYKNCFTTDFEFSDSSSIDWSQTLVFIDPPYYLPYEPGTKRKGVGAMTPAYPGHNVSGEYTYNLAFDSVKLALERGAKRVVHTNYWCRDMQQAMEYLSHRYNVPLHTTLIGTLIGMNHSRKNVTNRVETAWEFGGDRMFQPKRIPL